MQKGIRTTDDIRKYTMAAEFLAPLENRVKSHNAKGRYGIFPPERIPPPARRQQIKPHHPNDFERTPPYRGFYLSTRDMRQIADLVSPMTAVVLDCKICAIAFRIRGPTSISSIPPAPRVEIKTRCTQIAYAPLSLYTTPKIDC